MTSSGDPINPGLTVGTPRRLTDMAVGATGLVIVTRLSQLSDVDLTGAPADRPLVFRLHPDGVYRPEPLAAGTGIGWGDEVRFGAGAPDTTAEAPAGVWHLDYTTGSLYQKES